MVIDMNVHLSIHNRGQYEISAISITKGVEISIKDSINENVYLRLELTDREAFAIIEKISNRLAEHSRYKFPDPNENK